MRLVEKGDLQGVQRLVQSGAVGINDRHPPDAGSTALMLAADKGHQPMVQGLLALGADCNAPELRPVRTSSEAAEMMDEKHINNSEACYGHHGTALMRAAFRGHEGVIKALLAAGAEVDTVDSKGDAALNYAIYGKHRGAVQALLAGGASPNLQNLTGSSVLNLLACSWGDVEAFDDLVQAGADPLQRTIRGCTVLMDAVNQPALMSHILSTYPGLDVNACDNDGCTALHGALELEAVELLLKAGAQVNAVDNSGRSPLLYMGTMGKPDLVRALLAAGADALQVTDDGRNALTLLVGRRSASKLSKDDELIRRMLTKAMAVQQRQRRQQQVRAVHME